MAIIALQSAATGLSALNTALDVTANNLANVNTAGFKSSRANFQDLIYQHRAQPGVENSNGDQRPIGLAVGLGTKVSGTQLNFEAGSHVQTDRPYDVKIEGNGFFQVNVQNDLSGSGIAYTRSGQFTRNADGELVLATDHGRRLVGGITIPDDTTDIEIDAEGRVFVQQPGNNTPSEIGQIELANFVNPEGLKQIGENLYVESAASGTPVVGTPGSSGFGQLQQGAYEASNVNPTLELISLIKTQRAFEMNSQTIRTADEVLRAVAQLRR